MITLLIALVVAYFVLDLIAHVHAAQRIMYDSQPDLSDLE